MVRKSKGKPLATASKLQPSFRRCSGEPKSSVNSSPSSPFLCGNNRTGSGMKTAETNPHLRTLSEPDLRRPPLDRIETRVCCSPRLGALVDRWDPSGTTPTAGDRTRAKG
ncbi:hypothetical protein GQ457_08G025130 [Hibiscus cannabinus]